MKGKIRSEFLERIQVLDNQNTYVGLLDPEADGSMILRNADGYLPVDTLRYVGRLEPSTGLSLEH